MQEIVNYYVTICEATGGKAQKEKVTMFIWKWKNNKIVEVPMNVRMREETINRINVKDSVKTLGVYVSPS